MIFRTRTTTRAAAMLAAALLAFGAAPAATAQAYPAKTLRILVGFAPGGAMDIVARTVGQKMAASIGQSVVIDNKPGAASNIAIRQLIDSPPDGYTVMLVANGLTANPLLYTQQPLDPHTDAFLLKGKTQPVVAHELICRAAECADRQKTACAIFAEARQAFERRHWDDASEKFAQSDEFFSGDAVSRFYLKLCKQYRVKSPPEGWSGTIAKDEK